MKHCLCHRWWAQDCDGWPLTHRELICSLTEGSWLVTKRSSQQTIGWRVDGRSARIKTRSVSDGPLGKVGRRVGVGAHQAEGQKKSWKGTFCEKKIVHSEQPRTKFLHRPSEVFNRNLGNAHRRAEWSKKNFLIKNMPSFLASMQSGCLLKMTF